MSGLFITFEGTEGAGKSTLIKEIEIWLKEKEIDFVSVREPGGTILAEKMRAILKTPCPEEKLCDKSELLLMYAARAQLVETLIKPALAKGQCVICDRHDLSTVAYQGGGRGLPMDEIDSVRKVALGNFRPDLTLLLDIDPKVGMQRARSRGALDRFELEQLSFFERVRNAYLDAAKRLPYIKVIDASKTVEEVRAEAISALEALL